MRYRLCRLSNKLDVAVGCVAPFPGKPCKIRLMGCPGYRVAFDCRHAPESCPVKSQAHPPATSEQIDCSKVSPVKGSVKLTDRPRLASSHGPHHEARVPTDPPRLRDPFLYRIPKARSLSIQVRVDVAPSSGPGHDYLQAWLSRIPGSWSAACQLHTQNEGARNSRARIWRTGTGEALYRAGLEGPCDADGIGTRDGAAANGLVARAWCPAPG